MALTRDQVKHVAKLANLPLTEEEEVHYAKQLSQILDYVDQLEKADTKGVEPAFNVIPHFNVFQAGETQPSLSQDEALANASNKKDGYFVIKGVFEE
ncbi:Asp-tRNA(Asn)/Glu-tRNA(Gln) amidotransferase subunit GatC [Candidatus Daviesbacteria bacterium]|nr:Asp-tRNA(Asn)/Glu-tRNA(Gln) amidotransferase subunit GatC [Candidatus Daviesbacteria bacterium]